MTLLLSIPIRSAWNAGHDKFVVPGVPASDHRKSVVYVTVFLINGSGSLRFKVSTIKKEALNLKTSKK